MDNYDKLVKHVIGQCELGDFNCVVMCGNGSIRQILFNMLVKQSKDMQVPFARTGVHKVSLFNRNVEFVIETQKMYNCKKFKNYVIFRLAE